LTLLSFPLSPPPPKRGIQRIRAGKIADAAEAEAEAAAASGKAPHQQQQQQATLLPQQQQQQQHGKQQQQQQQRYAHYSDDEVLAGVGEPSEWDMSWTAADYTQHPQVGTWLKARHREGRLKGGRGGRGSRVDESSE